MWWGVRKAVGSLSLSARRAWIEILKKVSVIVPSGVALRKESVDRNIIKSISYLGRFRSLSARRAWIEILTDDVSTGGKISRSPQGERG